MIGLPQFRAPEAGLTGGEIARYRWIWLGVLSAAAAAALVPPGGGPAFPAAAVICAGLVANALASRRPSAVAAPLVLDVALLGALLALAGRPADPLAALLAAPAFIGALSVAPRSAVPVAAAAAAAAGVLVAVPDGAFRPVAWLAVCAMAGLAAMTGARADRAADARRDAERALAEAGASDAAGLAFAAAAHEIATPVSTIRVAAADLARDLADRPEALADALLIEREARRCGEILAEARGSREAGEPMTLSAIVDRASAPHRGRGIAIRVGSLGTPPEPSVRHARDAILGLRNVIQNAVDFARREVRIEIAWTADGAEVTVRDDGAGFPADILAGSPPGPGRSRPRGGPGTGNGLALARALLARGGGAMELGSGTPGGALVRIVWDRPGGHG